MNQFVKRSIHFFAVSFFTLIILASCDKDMSVMLDNSATSNVGVTMTDTFTVNTSTVQLWDMPSAGTGRILVGKTAIPQAGTAKSTSYFRIGFSTIVNDIPETAVFDSLTLVLKPDQDAYYFGDTTETQTIHVHQLMEALAERTPTPRFPNEELPWYITQSASTTTIYSEQTFDYNPTSIGTLSFRPRPRSRDSLSTRLDDNIGQDFFNRIKTGDIQMSSYENFIAYFKGLVLVPDEDNTTIMGFTDEVQVRINYSYPGVDGHRQTGFKTLSIVEPWLQHNNIAHDRSGTAFEELSTRKELSTSATGGLTYVQAGTGVVAKISFPSLKEFLHTENMAINKAELIIETSSKANTMYPIPGNLVLFINDHNGVPRSVLPTSYAGQSSPQQAVFVPGQEMGQNGTYTFELMEYLQQLKSAEVYNNTSFYLTANPLVLQTSAGEQFAPNLFRTFNTALIASDDAKPKIKLRILYTKFR